MHGGFPGKEKGGGFLDLLTLGKAERTSYDIDMPRIRFL